MSDAAAFNGNGLHWVTRFDPDDGEPYGEICDCDIGADHDGKGNLISWVS